MWVDRASNPGPLTYESGALPTALCGPALSDINILQRQILIGMKDLIVVRITNECQTCLFVCHFLEIFSDSSKPTCFTTNNAHVHNTSRKCGRFLFRNRHPA